MHSFNALDAGSPLRVWITGASGGLGTALARYYAGQSATLLLSSRSSDTLTKLAGTLSDSSRVSLLPFDLEGECGTLLRSTSCALELLGGLDILILNAGVSQRSRAGELRPSDLERLLQVNFTANAHIATAALPALRESNGRIVVISSLAGRVGVPLRSGYSAAKHALHGYFETLAIEEPRVSVTMVVGGFIRTDISTRAIGADGVTWGVQDENQKRGADPQHVARRIARAAAERRREIGVALKVRGRLLLLLQRFAPGLLRRLLVHAKVT